MDLQLGCKFGANITIRPLANKTHGGTGGYTSDGLTLRPVPGELFSFDGVHPSNRGHAAIVNETIEVINDTYGASIPPVDVGAIPEGLPQAVPTVDIASD